MPITEKEKSIERMKFEIEKLKRRKREMENQFLSENKIDKLVFDSEYQGINSRIEEIEKQIEIDGKADKMGEEISEFRQRLKKEVEKMLKER